MAVERDKAPASFEYRGKTYYFCSKGGMREFQERLDASAEGQTGMQSV